jgi:hypothetical protein
VPRLSLIRAEDLTLGAVGRPEPTGDSPGFERAGQLGGVDRRIRDSVDEGAGSAYAIEDHRAGLAAMALATPIPAMPHATPSGGPIAQIGPFCLCLSASFVAAMAERFCLESGNASAAAASA